MHGPARPPTPAAGGNAGDALVLSLAGAVTVAFWLPLLVEDPRLGFGLGELPLADWVRITLLIAHILTAPLAYVVALVLLRRRERRAGQRLAILGVPVAVLTTILGALLAMPVLVAAGPVAFTALTVWAAVLASSPQDGEPIR